MNRKSILAIALTAGLAGALSLRAASPPEGRAGPLMKLRDDLALTAPQKQQLRQLVVANRREIAEAVRPVIEQRRALQEAATADPLDEAAVREAAGELGKRIGDAALLAGRLKKDVAAILTPEQMKTLGDAGDELTGRIESVLDRLEAGGR